MPSDGLIDIVRELLLEQGGDASTPRVNAAALMLETVSLMRRSGRMPSVPIETLVGYVDGTLSEDDAREVERQIEQSPAARADVELIRTVTSRIEAEDPASDVSDEVGERIFARVQATLSEGRTAAEGSEPASIPFPLSQPKWAGLVGMAASWVGPLLLAIEGCRELLLVTQHTGPVFMGGRGSLEALPEVDHQDGDLVVKVIRTKEPATWPKEAWALNPTGRRVARAPIDKAGWARFVDLPKGRYRINTDRGIGEVKARLSSESPHPQS
jgi:anti-sigma-K factor RskA